jgi:hypothetical protein
VTSRFQDGTRQAPPMGGARMMHGVACLSHARQSGITGRLTAAEGGETLVWAGTYTGQHWRWARAWSRRRK